MKEYYYAWCELMRQHYRAMNATAFLVCRNQAARVLMMYHIKLKES